MVRKEFEEEFPSLKGKELNKPKFSNRLDWLQYIIRENINLMKNDKKDFWFSFKYNFFQDLKKEISNNIFTNLSKIKTIFGIKFKVFKKFEFDFKLSSKKEGELSYGYYHQPIYKFLSIDIQEHTIDKTVLKDKIYQLNIECDQLGEFTHRLLKELNL